MRHDHEYSLGVRLTVAAGGAFLLLIPFAVITAFVAARSGWLHDGDQQITDALHDYAQAHPHWVAFMRIWSWVFDPNVWRIAAVGLIIWLIRRRAHDLALWVAVTMIAGGVLNAVLKLIFERHRPEFLDPVARAAGYSFPSGHALNNAVGAAVFALVLLPVVRRRWRPVLWTGAIVIPFVTGLSRVFLGVHWTSDVVGGWLLGAAVVAVTATGYLGLRERRRRRTNLVADGLDPAGVTTHSRG